MPLPVSHPLTLTLVEERSAAAASVAAPGGEENRA